MYCERLHTATDEWIILPVDLTELLHDRNVVQLSHGSCPLCLAAHLDEPPDW